MDFKSRDLGEHSRDPLPLRPNYICSENSVYVIIIARYYHVNKSRLK